MGNRKNAGCYRMTEEGKYVDVTEHVNKVIDGPDENPFVELTVKLIMLYAVITYAAVCLTGCGTWEVKFGMSEYNKSAESREYSEGRKR